MGMENVESGLTEEDLIRYEMRRTGLGRDELEQIFQHPDVQQAVEQLKDGEGALRDLDAVVKTVILEMR